jgi:Xaa-Pro dipeptidase
LAEGLAPLNGANNHDTDIGRGQVLEVGMTLATRAQPQWAADIEELKLPVSRAEIDARRDKLLESMANAGIDVAVITSPQALFYLTAIEFGFAFGYPLVLDASGQHRQLVRMIDHRWESIWAPISWVTSWAPYWDQDDVDVAIADAIKAIHRGGVRRIGFELDRPSVSFSTVNRVVSLAGGEAIDISPIIDEMRVVKSNAELDLIRRAGVISSKAVDTIVQSIKGGATDVEAAIEAEAVIVRDGEHGPWPPYVFTGQSGESGHIPFVRKAPGPGETVTWFVSGHVHGYACPIERTIVREPDKNGVVKLADAVASAVESLMAEMRPGMTSGDVYEIALRSHKERGVEKWWLNHAGYMFGIKWSEFELFRFRQGDPRIVRAGMTMHLVPCLIVPDVTNVCASKTIVVTESGGAPLNDYPLRLEAF